MHIYDIVIIGGGAAGTMAAISASRSNKNVLLLEKNPAIGKKILITGKGRCNITNTADLDVFIEKFGKQGNFLRTAFYKFSNQHLMDFFKSKHLKLKNERQGRVFPVTDKSYSVTEVLQKCLDKAKIDILYKASIVSINKSQDLFCLCLSNDKKICAKKVILATGGLSFQETGSSGDGFRISKSLGHTITPLLPALVPLKTKESWPKELQGTALRNIRIVFFYNKKKITSSVGELMFTHFGVSGPLVLDLSGEIVALVSKHIKVKLFIDLKPGLNVAKLDARLLNEFKRKGHTQLSTVIRGMLPRKMVPVFIRLAGLNPDKEVSHITQKERRIIVDMLKALPLTIKEPLPIDKAMVTNGGVSTKEINPRTMESRLVPGLYFAGEVIDGAASSGGYNLQQAFSTGFLAGENAASI